MHGDVAGVGGLAMLMGTVVLTVSTGDCGRSGSDNDSSIGIVQLMN